MAKWGEGDPRWIVEERPDATNVNNWHWTERDASGWSQDRIKELFNNCKIETEAADLKIIDVNKCEGEASANNRKGKLIFFYEWKLVLNWEGILKDSTGGVHKGLITIPNISEENEMHEIDIQVSVEENTDEADVLKELMRQVGKATIHYKLTEYVDTLKLQFSKGMILPKKDGESHDLKITNLTSGFNKMISMVPVVSNTNNTTKHIDTTTLKFKEKFQCRALEFYEAFTRIELVRAFTRGDVKLDLREGGEFALFGGNIHGSFEKLDPGKKITQKWRYKLWPEGHFSTVQMSIDEKADHTEVNIVQKGVPSSEANVTKQNWERYYWNAIKQTFGYGTSLP